MTDSYSPFVASSYELSKSDAFIACGYTVPCQTGSDTRKQWMFVFKIRKDHWYRTQDAHDGRPVDFAHNWFDETSFGKTGLADGENAFDHLGTALEDEYEDIMYVHNMDNQQAITLDGLPVDDPYMVAKGAQGTVVAHNPVPSTTTTTMPPVVAPIVTPPVAVTPPNKYTEPVKKPGDTAVSTSAGTVLELSFTRPSDIKKSDLTSAGLAAKLEKLFKSKLPGKIGQKLSVSSATVNADGKIVMQVSFAQVIAMSDFTEALKGAEFDEPLAINVKKIK